MKLSRGSITAWLLVLIFILALATGVAALISPRATRYAAAGLIIIVMIAMLLNPSLNVSRFSREAGGEEAGKGGD